MDKKSLIICNPPITFATNLKTHYGHLFYSTILDVSARFRKNFLKERVYFPSRTYNICGKPSEKLMKEKRLTVLKF